MADEHKNIPDEGSVTEGMMTSKNDIIRMISEFNHDPILHKLRKFLDHKNMFDILGVSRKEVNHSAFLAWLFDSSEEHGLGALPTSRLLDFIVSDIVVNPSKRTNDVHGIDYLPKEKLLNQILYHDYRINFSHCELERSTDTGKFIDIWIKCDLRIGTEENKKVNIIIENKVGSLFHDDQLNYYSKEIEKKCAKDDLNLYVYLAPDKNDVYEKLKKSKTNKKADQYVPMSYQDLLEEVLLPSLDKENLPARTKMLLEEYIHELSKPNTNNKISIMAMGDKTKELLNAFYETHQDLLISILDVIAEDDSNPDRAEKATDMAEALREAKVTTYIDGEKVKSMPEFARQVVLRYILKIEKETGNKPTLQELRELFGKVDEMLSPGNRPFINTTYIKVAESGNKHKRWNDVGEDVEVFDTENNTSTKIYTSTEWKSNDNFVKFIEFVKNNEVKLGIIVS